MRHILGSGGHHQPRLPRLSRKLRSYAGSGRACASGEHQQRPRWQPIPPYSHTVACDERAAVLPQRVVPGSLKTKRPAIAAQLPRSALLPISYHAGA